jgi:hypothetical protein
MAEPEHDPARARFFALGLFRLSGALITVFGLLIFTERFGFVAGSKARQMGAIVIIVGLLQFVLIPRILSRAWRTPRIDDPQL